MFRIIASLFYSFLSPFHTMLHPKRNLFFTLLFCSFSIPLCLVFLLTLAPFLGIGYLFLLLDKVNDGISDSCHSSAKTINIFFVFYCFLAQSINALKGVIVYATGWFLNCRPASFGRASFPECLNDEII